MLFFKSYKDAGWYQNADINDDGIMDMKDLGIAAKHFGTELFLRIVRIRPPLARFTQVLTDLKVLD